MFKQYLSATLLALFVSARVLQRNLFNIASLPNYYCFKMTSEKSKEFYFYNQQIHDCLENSKKEYVHALSIKPKITGQCQKFENTQNSLKDGFKLAMDHFNLKFDDTVAYQFIQIPDTKLMTFNENGFSEILIGLLMDKNLKTIITEYAKVVQLDYTFSPKQKKEIFNNADKAENYQMYIIFHYSYAKTEKTFWSISGFKLEWHFYEQVENASSEPKKIKKNLEMSTILVSDNKGKELSEKLKLKDLIKFAYDIDLDDNQLKILGEAMLDKNLNTLTSAQLGVTYKI